VTEAACKGCGCTDSRACVGGCSWAWVDRAKGEGMCSACVIGMAQRAAAGVSQNAEKATG